MDTWFDTLPDALKSAPYFKPPESGEQRTIEQVVSDLGNASKLQGNLAESHIKVPPKDAAAEDIKAFQDRVLKTDPTLIRKPNDHSPVPKDADGYTDPTIEGFAGDTAAAKALAVEGGWTQKQYTAFVTQLATETAAGADAQATWSRDQKTKLKEALGDAQADHLMRTEAVIRKANPALADSLRDGKLDASITLALDTLVHKIMDMGGEDREFNDQSNAGDKGYTPAEAKTKANEIRTEMLAMRQSDPRYKVKQEELLHFQKLSKAA